MSQKSNISVAIPTYRRERVLIDTIAYLLALPMPPDEILVLDQTPLHETETSEALRTWHEQGGIRWVRLPEPSIPKAMNQGLLLARHDVVLFVDDDIRPEPDLLSAHLAAHQKNPGTLVAGRVIQPWQEGQDFSDDSGFHFASMTKQWIREFMGGNFSVPRLDALQLGGFDENFVRVAYRFEAEFAHRWLKAGRDIYFEPEACLHHLKDAGGGTRSYGEHLTTIRPDHAVGDYYYLLKTRQWGGLLRRPLRAISTRYHLSHPWGIPVTLLAEIRALLWGIRLHRSGPRLISAKRIDATDA